MCEAVVTENSLMKRIVALFVIEVKPFSATQCTKYMLYVHRIFNIIGLKVKVPVIIELINKEPLNCKTTGVLEEEYNMMRYIINI